MTNVCRALQSLNRVFFFFLFTYLSFALWAGPSVYPVLLTTQNEKRFNCPEVEALSMPNAFTPNGDGVNDEFCLQGWSGCVKTFRISIFSRWGEKIFESSTADFCWDGKFKGQAMESDVYLFRIEAHSLGGDYFTRSGELTLIR